MYDYFIVAPMVLIASHTKIAQVTYGIVIIVLFRMSGNSISFLVLFFLFHKSSYSNIQLTKSHDTNH